MKKIYIAGPFRGTNRWRNIDHARRYAFFVASLGGVPICPHTMWGDFDGTLTDDFWLRACIELMESCDAIYMLDGWQQSRGALGELDHALTLGLRDFYDIDALATYMKQHAEVTAPV